MDYSSENFEGHQNYFTTFMLYALEGSETRPLFLKLGELKYTLSSGVSSV